MHILSKRLAGAFQSIKHRLIATAIVVGGTLMVTGCLLSVLLDMKGGEALAAMWPYYLGGVVALLVGWLSGEFRTLN